VFTLTKKTLGANKQKNEKWNWREGRRTIFCETADANWKNVSQCHSTRPAGVSFSLCIQTNSAGYIEFTYSDKFHLNLGSIIRDCHRHGTKLHTGCLDIFDKTGTLFPNSLDATVRILDISKDKRNHSFTIEIVVPVRQSRSTRLHKRVDKNEIEIPCNCWFDGR
jgi:hypothetical protein